VVGAANVDLSETEICKQRVGPVLIERIPQTPAALPVNAGLFKIRTSKPIAEQQAEAEVANAALFANQICKPCAAQRLVVAQANVGLYEIATCRRLVGR
jgi:hypothetical protein